MNTFDLLLVGHLVGDWLLQNDWMARGKRGNVLSLAGMVHFATYTATVMGALWLFGDRGLCPAFYLAGSILVFVSHWLIDATCLAGRWMLFFRQSDLDWVRVVVDQTLHILVLTILALLSMGNQNIAAF
jgi:hypothetical protein